MTESKKRKEEARKNVPLSQLLLDCKKDKYRLVSLVTRWAQEIRGRDQQVPLHHHELLDMALREILSGEVSLEHVEKLPPLPKGEKKSAEALAKDMAEKFMSRTVDNGKDGEKDKEK